MRREGKIHVSITKKRYDKLSDEYKKKYNRPIATNQTVKKAYNCPKGKRNCPYCHNKDNGKTRRLELKREMLNY